MAPKRQQLTPPRPPPSASSTSSEEDEDDSSSSETQQQQQQQQLKQQQPISTPVSSQIPKKPTSKTLVNKPASSSTSNDDDDDDEDGDGGGEEDDDDDDSEDEAEKSKFKISQPISKNTTTAITTSHNNNTNSKANTKPIPKQQQKHQSDNDEDDGDEDETADADDDDDAASDPDLPPNKASRADPAIKPISSKSMDASASKSLKSPPPSKSSPAPPPPKSSVQKRPAPSSADSNGKDPKKRQKAVPAAPDDDDDPAAKKQLFQRVWTEADEIAILKGLVEFSKGGSSSSLDLQAFHDSIKDSFKSDLSKRQVSEKIRRLKNKFQNIAQKEKMGKEPTIGKDHERLLYQLSKKIWGKDDDADSNKKHPTAKANRTRKAAEDAVESKSPARSKPSSAAIPHDLPAEDHTPIDDGVRKLETLYPNLSDALSSGGINVVLGLGESHVRRALESMDHCQVKEWDQRWMDLQARERDLCMERATLVYDMVKQCYEAIKSSTK